ncbi:hypothetical protein OEA41_001524 [Lepraria neglecta]|uniref:Uncharacterized protein n=1 Tax=Lepraria neglecta TaxID=209136 RepID=A0AAD9Z9W9_9LECA|nr:hypothetical protein OEA41_001524 [Lepraria neglecta]
MPPAPTLELPSRTVLQGMRLPVVGATRIELQDDDAIYGLMSSHPAACLAAAKAFGSGINTVAVGFIRDNAEAIMESSPISYVKDAELRGSLFNPEDTSGVISSVYTQFFVDHTEPLEALAWVREGLDWPLGELLDGYEFLLMIELKGSTVGLHLDFLEAARVGKERAAKTGSAEGGTKTDPYRLIKMN